MCRIQNILHMIYLFIHEYLISSTSGIIQQIVVQLLEGKFLLLFIRVDLM